MSYLYHGSGVNIRGKYLRPFKPGDISHKDNGLLAVYATDRKRIAIGMSLTRDDGTKSMANYDEKKFQVTFIEGEPRRKKRYVYTIARAGFIQTPAGGRQWTSPKPAKILKKDVYDTADLGQYWRKSTKRDRARYAKAKRLEVKRKSRPSRRATA